MQTYEIQIDYLGQPRKTRNTKMVRAAGIDNLRRNLIAKGISSRRTDVYVSKVISKDTVPVWIGVMSYEEYFDAENRISEFRPSWSDEKLVQHWVSPKTGKLIGRL